MPASETPGPPTTATWRRDLLLLLLGFGALYFFRLGSYPFSNPDEGRNAEIPREMLATGDWVTPRLDGVNYFEKPPLVYWVTAALGKIFGLNEWSVRAVPVLFALAGILLTYAAARALYGRHAGRWSALVLGTSLFWFGIGHIPILDMAVSVLMAATLFCFLLGVREPTGSRRRWFFLGLYASAALATLTKGLMGFLVTGAVMFLWLVIFKQWKRLRPLYLPSGILLFLAIAAPWHVLAAMRNETWAHRYFVFEHFERFLTPVADRPGPIYYFVGIVIAGLIPWTGFLWPATRDALRGMDGPTAGTSTSLKGAWARRRENADAWFLPIWAAFIFVFFSISKSKLAPYILPIFPALAVLIGRWLAATVAENAGARLRNGLRVFTFLCGLLAVALCMVVTRPDLLKLDAVKALALQPPAFVMAAVLLLGGIFAPWFVRVRGPGAGLSAVVLMMGAFFVTLLFAAPHISKPATKELALFVKTHAQPADRVFHCYDYYQDFTFYAERLVGVVGSNRAELELIEDAAARTSGRFISDTELLAQWSQPGRIFLVVQERKIREVKADYAKARLAWERRAQGAEGALLQSAPERPIFADPAFRYHLIAQTPVYYLLSNQP
jgi:4-amino-4-deoxy-L-arabinose transferase-like glycosyltransferase